MQQYVTALPLKILQNENVKIIWIFVKNLHIYKISATLGKYRTCNLQMLQIHAMWQPKCHWEYVNDGNKQQNSEIFKIFGAKKDAKPHDIIEESCMCEGSFLYLTP